MRLKLCSIKDIDNSRIPSHGVARHQHSGIHHFAKAGERLAQVVFCVDVGHFAPQQCGQRLALLRPAGDGEIGQQRRGFVGDKTANRHASAADIQAAKQPDLQNRRHYSLPINAGQMIVSYGG